jgi:small-conductance mechanosensitive channel
LAHILNNKDLEELIDYVLEPGALIELVTLAACLAAAWMLVRLIRGSKAAPDSIWFGQRVFDGVLFPFFAVTLAYASEIAIHATVEEEIFKFAVPLLISLLVIRLTVRVLGMTFPQARTVQVVERSVSWLAWIAAVLWFTGALPALMETLDGVRWSVGTTRVSLRNVVEGSFMGALVMVLMLWASAGIEKGLLHGTGNTLSIRKMAANLARALLLFVGMLFSLSAVGIDLTALSVLGGAIGVGVGFGLREIAASYVSGFIVLAERSLRVGDMVRVDGFEGCITDIRTRYAVIRALNGRVSIVPNQMLVTKRVENSSLTDRKVSVSSVVQVAYGTDIRALQPKIEAAMARVARVIADPPPTAQLADFAKSGIDLNITFWIADPENGQGSVRSEVNLAVLDLLKAEGIEIPYPQQVTHVRMPPESPAQRTWRRLPIEPEPREQLGF